MCSDLGPVFTDGTSGGLGSQTGVSPRLSTHPAVLENTGGRRRQCEWRGTECTPSPRVHGASVSAGGGGERPRVRVLARPSDGDGAVEARGTEETGRAGYGGGGWGTGGAWGAIWHWKGGWDQAKTEGGKGPSLVFWGEPFDQGNHLCKAAWTVPGCSRSSCVAGGSGQRGGGQEMRGEAAFPF